MSKPKTIPNLPFAEYFEIDALNASTLKHFAKTPKHARHAILHDKPDVKSLVIGHASHTMILEPENFAGQYAIFNEGAVLAQVYKDNPESKNPRATKIYKDAKAVWEAKNAGHSHLTSAEEASCKAIRDAVMAHPVASQLFKGEGECELTLLWNLEIGEPAKARIDRLTYWNGFNCVVDLKTWNPKTGDAILDARSVSKQIHQFAYHNQAAWYLDALAAIEPGTNFIFLFVFVEQEAPHDVAVFELSAEAIERGRAENAERLATWRKCKETGIWPGVSNEIVEVGLPEYA